MSSKSLSKLCNLLKTNDKNKLSIVKIKFSKMCIKVVSVLLKEGFIRGFYISTYNNEKILFYKIKSNVFQCTSVKHPLVALVNKQ